MTTLGFADISNVGAVARREFVARACTRTFVVSTLALALLAALVGLVPVAIGYFTRDSARVAVYVGASDLRADPVSTLDALLNPPPKTGDAAAPARKAFTVSLSTDLDGDRRQVLDGKLTALLDVERDATGAAVFTLYTKETGDRPTAVVGRQAAASIAMADRLARAGIDGAGQAALFAAPQVTIRSPDLSKPVEDRDATAQQIADLVIVLGLEMFLLLAIILYGNWVAQSVVEEKSSRMMEIILGAASPFQLLAGKVIGVSASALLQFATVVGAAIAALLAEGQVASMVLGETAAVDLPSGLTPALLVSFALLFVLGFVLYATLFAAAGSLVSRQEDISQIVLPMTFVSSAGYLIGMYSSIGTLDASAPWVVALSWVPFVSPYMMLTRFAAGEVGLAEVGVAALLLVATIVVVAWAAARIYAAGVLLYGQKPSFRGMWAAVRQAR